MSADRREAAIKDAYTEIRRCLELLIDTKEISENDYDEIQDILRHKRRSPSASSYSNPTKGALSPRNGPQYVEAIYAWSGEQKGDLELCPGDIIEVITKKSPQWYEGRLNGKVGVFPTNYVKLYSSDDRDSNYQRTGIKTPVPTSAPHSAPHSAPPPSHEDYDYTPPPPRASPYNPPQQMQMAPPPPTQQYYAQPPPMTMQQQPLPYPPPSTGYYQQPQQPQTIIVHDGNTSGGYGGGSSTFGSIGSKLGNAALFGAGSAFGADIVNDIF
ncbi:hypothetical protein TBLA_0D02910 [Henningerozyma blattae CBS 6284]|uniref:SH3 domain-containing protein n=1 Tax=Henningerozyma blattae (strain ATCC 34711 / CBS 6284 / DSM 70876 / NBRC 10599 / NRRL Y-10934 / UCD 77-7) TaxID=1071380 RepID=I2H339_HENB6|nr:hypothetical protein TBLA_0D02910 [Tetrapisispora blattae CBS 6284]CCH60791.1 hypothetical protein TBLA_0D02910 [Tetrapisispora blattae CBS 6284]